jgi:hypothetical protein
MGKCQDHVNSDNVAYGRSGRGLGRGAGFGFRYRFGGNQQQFLTNVSERILIENEINILKDQLSSLEKQLKDLKQDD